MSPKLSWSNSVLSFVFVLAALWSCLCMCTQSQTLECFNMIWLSIQNWYMLSWPAKAPLPSWIRICRLDRGIEPRWAPRPAASVCHPDRCYTSILSDLQRRINITHTYSVIIWCIMPRVCAEASCWCHGMHCTYQQNSNKIEEVSHAVVSCRKRTSAVVYSSGIRNT